MLPDDFCESRLATWCSQHCPHAKDAPLYARFGTDAYGGPNAWRCYARGTLSPDLSSYQEGATYCTRHAQILAQLEGCRDARGAASVTHATQVGGGEAANGQMSSVAVGSNGRVTLAEGSSKDATVSVDFVVVHCRERLSWLADARQALVAGFTHAKHEQSTLAVSLHVLEKCNEAASDMPSDGWAERTHAFLENKGEECYAYLTFLVERYDLIADYVVFLQGDGGIRQLASKFATFGETVVAAHTSDVWRSANDHQYIAIGASPEACTNARMPRGLEGNCQSRMPKMYQCMQKLYLRHWGMPLPSVVCMYTNAQAGVSRDRIHGRPRSFYAGLLSEFEAAPENECYVVPGKRAIGAHETEQAALMRRPFRGTCALMEYLWPITFGEKALLDRTHTMSNRFALGML